VSVTLHARPRRLGRVRLFLGMAFLVLVGVAAVYSSSGAERTLGFVMVVTVAIAIPLLLLGFWMEQTYGTVALSSEGIHGGTSSTVFVPWSAVTGAVAERRLLGWCATVSVTTPSAIAEPAVMRLLRSREPRIRFPARSKSQAVALANAVQQRLMTRERVQSADP
jgi:hypothetical protein